MKYIAVLFCVLGLTIAGCGGDKKSDKSGKSATKTTKTAPTSTTKTQ